MSMHNPPHPGGVVKRQCLEPMGSTVCRVFATIPISQTLRCGYCYRLTCQTYTASLNSTSQTLRYGYCYWDKQLQI